MFDTLSVLEQSKTCIQQQCEQKCCSDRVPSPTGWMLLEARDWRKIVTMRALVHTASVYTNNLGGLEDCHNEGAASVYTNNLTLAGDAALFSLRIQCN